MKGELALNGIRVDTGDRLCAFVWGFSSAGGRAVVPVCAHMNATTKSVAGHPPSTLRKHCLV